MTTQSEVNKTAWSYKAYEFWINDLGQPTDLAKDMLSNPKKYVQRHLDFLGNVEGKRIANILGSIGKKAIPLAILGADVTIVDISLENKRYALEVAKEANTNLTYILSDFLELDISNLTEYFDIAYLEGGVLHYFSDLNVLSSKIYDMIKPGGRLVLNDFHPIRKILKKRDIFDMSDDRLELYGDYFESDLHVGDVAYKKFFPTEKQNDFPDCLLRYWTMGEIITAFASAGFIIKKLVEGPRFDCYKNIPGEFTLVAYKTNTEK